MTIGSQTYYYNITVNRENLTNVIFSRLTETPLFNHKYK